MPAFEKRFLTWIEKHLLLLGGIFLTLLGGGLRLALGSLYAQAAGMSDNSLSMWSGFLTAATAAFVTAKQQKDEKRVKSFAVYVILLLSPAGLFSTVVFGSFGDLSVAAAILALYFYGGRRFLHAYLCLALSCFLGVQGLFLLPVFVLLCIRDEEHDLFCFLIPLAGFGARLAAGFAGFDLLGEYLPPGFAEKRLYAGFPSFWAFLNDRAGTPWDYYALGTMMVCLAVLVAFMIFFGKKSRKADPLLLALCCGLLVTGFLPGLDPAAASVTLIVWLLVVKDVRFILPAVLLEIIGLFPLAASAYGEEWLPLSIQWLSVLRIGVSAYLIRLAALSRGNEKVLDEKRKVC
ncbi:MAG: hypothetical protein K5697_13865 [Lachnospiraceae bacterium]|nr:hypothetical protein [Lachnospiraceae bacterium]